MFNISIYLDKFKKINSKESSLKDAIIASVNKVLEININRSNIEIRKNVIYLKINPIIKNEVFIKKKYIINELNAKNIPINDIF